MHCVVRCFADDTWLSMKINAAVDCAKLQENLKTVIEVYIARTTWSSTMISIQFASY